MNNFKEKKMKTLKYIFATILLVVIAGCNKTNISELENYGTEAMVIPDIETKTSLSNDGTVSWTAGDKLVIYDNLGGKNLFANTSEAVSTFTGNVSTGTTKFWGVYPDNLVTSTSSTDGRVTVMLPSNQTPVAGTFAEKHNIAVTSGLKKPGTPDVNEVIFKNVCGLVSFKVPERIAATKVTFTSTNTDITGTLMVDCETAAAMITANGGKTIVMEGSFTAGSTFYFVVAPGNITGFRIDVETNSGLYYHKSASTGLLKVRAGECINLGEIDFKKASAVAEHTYDGGVLTGTTLTVTHGIPEAFWSNVTAININVRKGGVLYRDYSATSVTGSSIIIPVGTGKTYLPQGTYDVDGSFTINGVVTTLNTTFTSPAPVLTGAVTVSATTSYSLYTAGNVGGANGHGADIISAVGASFTGISSAVLNELSASYKFTVDSKEQIGTTSATSITSPDFTGVSRGGQTLTCEITFDGATISGNTTCHITGLPYLAAPPKNTGSNPWSGSANSWTNDFVRLHKDTITQTFHAPADINVSVSHKARLYTRANKTTYTLKLSETNLYNKDQSSVGGQTTNIDETYQNKLASTNPSISAINTYGTIDAVLEYTNVKVYNISISYR